MATGNLSKKGRDMPKQEFNIKLKKPKGVDSTDCDVPSR